MMSKNLVVIGVVITFAGIVGIAVGIISNYPTMGAHAGIGVLGPTFFLSGIFVFIGLAILVVSLVKFLIEKNRPR